MFFPNTSIQTKLMLLACESAAVALLIACAGFAWHTVDSLFAAKGNQLGKQAEFIAWQAGPALALQDAEASQKLLASFWTDPTIKEARLYGINRELLATWGEQTSLTAPVSTPKGYRYVGFSQVEAVHNVVVGSQRLGTVYVRANTSDLMERLFAFARFAGYVVTLAMLIVLLVAIRLRRAIARPVLDLTKAAERVSNNADATIRIHTDARAELQTIQDAFNHMLARIQSSEAAARKANESFEDGVIARTRELSRELRRQQQAIAETESAKQAVEAAYQAKNDRLEKLKGDSHEPLRGIVHLTEKLMNESSAISPEDRQEWLATIHHHGSQLVDLFHSIPDRSTLAAGQSADEPSSNVRPQAPFAVTELPADRARTMPPASVSKAAQANDVCLTGKRILVVDDGESNRQLMQSVLRDAGAEVLTATDGLDAIHMTDQHHPELIVMDLQMPVMDGCSATRELRSNGHQLPIIALLSEGIDRAEEKSFEAGYTSYLAKPIEPTHLLQIVASQLAAMADPVTR